MSSSKWQQQPNRHYCALCNAWMANDRISIATHENGRKHKEAVEKDLQNRRADKLEEERRQRDMADSLRAIEAAAGKKLEEDLGSGAFAGYSYAGGAAATGTTGGYQPMPSHAGIAKAHSAAGVVQTKQPDAAAKKEMSSWNERKNKRKAVATDRKGGDGADGDDDADGGAAAAAKRRKVRKLAPDEGHYTVGDGDDKQTYLEGKVYAPILEEEMPIQIWIGDQANLEQEMRRDDRQHLWKMGLVLRVRKIQKKEQKKKPKAQSGFVEEGAEAFLNGGDEEEKIAVDVAYLRNSNDEDETIEKAVEPHRLRLLLGCDEMIPGTIEEARLDLMGGEEIIIEAHTDEGTAGTGAAAPTIDENTGLATWSTTTVRKVSANREAKEERARVRARRREEAERARQQERDLNERKMEEAKVANADDSALGSYDVWTGGKAGYKGVDIMKNDKVDVAVTAKSLSKGKGNVAFKKVGSGSSMFKGKAKKKKNRRVTSADDDEE